jgi:hypothetical protein
MEEIAQPIDGRIELNEIEECSLTPASLSLTVDHGTRQRGERY